MEYDTNQGTYHKFKFLKNIAVFPKYGVLNFSPFNTMLLSDMVLEGLKFNTPYFVKIRVCKFSVLVWTYRGNVNFKE